MFYAYHSSSSSSYHCISIPKLKKEIKFSFPNLFCPMANGVKTFQNQIYFDKNQPHVSIWTGNNFTKKLEIGLSCFGALNQKL
jgi:hypothetical protein